MRQFTRTATLVVKAENEHDADCIVAERLNGWFCEDTEFEDGPNGAGYPRGTLLIWTMRDGGALVDREARYE